MGTFDQKKFSVRNELQERKMCSVLKDEEPEPSDDMR